MQNSHVEEEFGPSVYDNNDDGGKIQDIPSNQASKPAK